MAEDRCQATLSDWHRCALPKMNSITLLSISNKSFESHPVPQAPSSGYSQKAYRSQGKPQKRF